MSNASPPSSSHLLVGVVFLAFLLIAAVLISSVWRLIQNSFARSRFAKLGLQMIDHPTRLPNSDEVQAIFDQLNRVYVLQAWRPMMNWFFTKYVTRMGVGQLGNISMRVIEHACRTDTRGRLVYHTVCAIRSKYFTFGDKRELIDLPGRQDTLIPGSCTISSHTGVSRLGLTGWEFVPELVSFWGDEVILLYRSRMNAAIIQELEQICVSLRKKDAVSHAISRT